MKKILITALCAALCVAISMFVGGPSETKLHIYTWSDYFDPELLEQFEKENSCKVVIDTFDSNEAAFAKLTAGATGYDLITPTTYFIPTMERNGIIKPFDMSLLTNVVRNFDTGYTKLVGTTNFSISVPYSFSITGIMYRKDALPEGFDEASMDWCTFTNPVFKGRATILNDPREIVGCSMKTLGFSVNSTNLEELAQALVFAKEWKRHILKMDNEMYKSSVASSELLVAMGYNSDSLQIMQDDDKVGFVVPKSGTTCSFDEFCLSATAKHPELAHAFVNFMYDPTNASKNIEYVCATMPVKGIGEIIDPDMKNRELVIPTEEIISRCELLVELPDGALETYTKFWDELKSSK